MEVVYEALKEGFPLVRTAEVLAVERRAEPLLSEVREADVVVEEIDWMPELVDKTEVADELLDAVVIMEDAEVAVAEVVDNNELELEEPDRGLGPSVKHSAGRAFGNLSPSGGTTLSS